VRADAHISVSKAEVGSGALARHAATRFDNGRTFVVAEGIGAPRTWGLTLEATLGGFERGLGASTQRGADRLEDAIFEARESLAHLGEALIERALPDAMIVGVSIDRGDLHVVSAGRGRAYLHRRGRPQRLTPRDEVDKGLLEAVTGRASVTLEPEDVVLIGSLSAFSTQAIERIAQVLAADPKTPPAILADVLTEPAARAGVGAAAIAFRVR
jgi:hypothetical protein